MVSSTNVVKVGDFGMAQDVYEREYYRQTKCIKKRRSINIDDPTKGNKKRQSINIVPTNLCVL
jgi:hypothetical protein